MSKDFNSIEEVKSFYGRRYRKVLDALAQKGAYDFCVGDGAYLDISFKLSNRYFDRIWVWIDIRDRWDIHIRHPFFNEEERYYHKTAKELIRTISEL